MHLPLSWLEWIAKRQVWTRPDLLTVDVAEAPDEGEALLSLPPMSGAHPRSAGRRESLETQD